MWNVEYPPVSHPDVKWNEGACLKRFSELINRHGNILGFVLALTHSTTTASHLLIHLVEFQIMQMPIQRIL